jgi:hypothetical protein
VLGARGEGGPAQQGTDPGHQHGGVDRLDDVVVGPRLQTRHHVQGVTARGHHQDRGQARLPDLPAQPDAVQPRQHHVQQQQIVRLLPEQFEAGQTVARGAHVIAVALQGHPDRPADHLVVLDEQHRDRIRWAAADL